MKYNNKIKYLELDPGDGNILKYFAKDNIENSESMIELCKMESPNSKIIEDNILNVDFDELIEFSKNEVNTSE